MGERHMCNPWIEGPTNRPNPLNLPSDTFNRHRLVLQAGCGCDPIFSRL